MHSIKRCSHGSVIVPPLKVHLGFGTLNVTTDALPGSSYLMLNVCTVSYLSCCLEYYTRPIPSLIPAYSHILFLGVFMDSSRKTARKYFSFKFK